MSTHHSPKYVLYIYSSLTFLLVLICYISFPGCKDSVTDPPDDKPLGYQEDIPWESLADSPWPMYRADPQSTGRSKWNNNITGRIIPTTVDYNIETSLSIGQDASVFFTTTDRKLFCLDSAGAVKWESPVRTNGEGAPYSPVILKDGSILAADITCLYKFNKTGQKLWEFQYNFTYVPSINVGKDGVIYIIGDFNNFLAISGEGALLWRLQESNERWSNSTAISPDGRTLYMKGNFLYSIDLVERKIKWKTPYLTGSPLVDSKGNIYCLVYSIQDSTELVCLDNSGGILWGYRFKDLAGTLTMDKKGNLYFGDVNVYSVNYNGKLNWKKDQINNYQPVMCDDKSNIYVIGYSSPGFSIRCISESGSVLWETNSNVNYEPAYGGALGFDKLFLPGWGRSPVFIIK